MFLSTLHYNYYYPGHWIMACPHTMYAPSPLPGEHSNKSSKTQLLGILHRLSHPTGYPFNTWVESGKLWINALPKDARPQWDSNTRPSVYKSRVRTATPRRFHLLLDISNINILIIIIFQTKFTWLLWRTWCWTCLSHVVLRPGATRSMESCEQSRTIWNMESQCKQN